MGLNDLMINAAKAKGVKLEDFVIPNPELIPKDVRSKVV